MAVRLPSNSATTEGKSTIAWQSEKPAPDHARHAGKTAKSTRIAAKAEAASTKALKD